MSQNPELLTAYLNFLQENNRQHAEALLKVLLGVVQSPRELHQAMDFIRINKYGKPVVGIDNETLTQSDIKAQLMRQMQKDIRENAGKPKTPKADVFTDSPEAQQKRRQLLDQLGVQSAAHTPDQETQAVFKDVLDFLAEINELEYPLTTFPGILLKAAEWTRNIYFSDPTMYSLSPEQLTRLQKQPVELDGPDVLKQARKNKELFLNIAQTLDQDKNIELITHILLFFKQKTDIKAESLEEIYELYNTYLVKFNSEERTIDNSAGMESSQPAYNLHQLTLASEFIVELNAWMMNLVNKK